MVDPNPILDLTTLLTTGRASESLTDFLGSAEQMSERVRFFELVSMELIMVSSGTPKMGNYSF